MFYAANGVSDWSLMSKLVASDRSSFDRFGNSVAVRENIVAVGAFTDSTSAGAYSGEIFV